MLSEFMNMCQQNKFLGFVAKMPQVHQLTLLYLIGFLQELMKHSDKTRMDKTDFAKIFGPLIVNPSRSKCEPAKADKLCQFGIVFFLKMLEIVKTSIIYPLNPGSLITASKMNLSCGKEEAIVFQEHEYVEDENSDEEEDASEAEEEANVE
jgi:hypothetical protein